MLHSNFCGNFWNILCSLCFSMFQLASAVFQVLYSHMWLIASLINNTNTECRYGEENGNKINISKRIGLTVHKGKGKKKKKKSSFEC